MQKKGGGWLERLMEEVKMKHMKVDRGTNFSQRTYVGSVDLLDLTCPIQIIVMTV